MEGTLWKWTNYFGGKFIFLRVSNLFVNHTSCLTLRDGELKSINCEYTLHVMPRKHSKSEAFASELVKCFPVIHGRM